MRTQASSLTAKIAPASGLACACRSGGRSASGGVAMTATLERLEQLVETLPQRVERELDEIHPPLQERPQLRVIRNDDEEVTDR